MLFSISGIKVLLSKCGRFLNNLFLGLIILGLINLVVTFFNPSSSSDYPYKNNTYKQQIYRVGAVCNDGTLSEAIGQGACSWHKGVKYWRMSNGSKEY